MNVNKVSSCDLIRPKLVNIAADELAEPLTNIIYSTIIQSIFPNNPKELLLREKVHVEIINIYFLIIDQQMY